MSATEERIYPPMHPGRVLELEFLEPLEMSAYQLAKGIGVDPPRVYNIIRGERAITADTALRLARYFGTSAEFWLNLQAHYDLEVEEAQAGESIEREVRPLAPDVVADPRAAMSSLPHPMETAQMENINKAAEKFAAALKESYRAVADRAVSAQELNAQLTQDFFNNVINTLRDEAESAREMDQHLADQQQRALEASRTLTPEAVAAYTHFVNSMFSSWRAGAKRG